MTRVLEALMYLPVGAVSTVAAFVAGAFIAHQIVQMLAVLVLMAIWWVIALISPVALAVIAYQAHGPWSLVVGVPLVVGGVVVWAKDFRR
jgi:hypothetical protein